MTQEYLANLGVNCEGKPITPWVERNLIFGLGLPEPDNELVLLPEDRFKIDWPGREISNSGAFSKIILGFDCKLNREVAIKVQVMKDEVKVAPEIMIQDFAREARLMMILDHPNIPEAFGLSVIKDRGEFIPAIVMERADGDLEGQRWLDPKKVSEMVMTIGGVVDYARSRGVVHSDIRPANILIKGDKFFLGDWGAAVDFKGRDELIGFYTYAAPELLRLAKLHRWIYPGEILAVDQHALAATAYDILTLFTSTYIWTEAGENRDDHQDEDVVLSPHKKINEEVYQVLARATSFKPEDRFSSCIEFGLALNEAIRA
ncbi:MAG: protein kinase [Candidatus Beckwithbacteria bacterium]